MRTSLTTFHLLDAVSFAAAAPMLSVYRFNMLEKIRSALLAYSHQSRNALTLHLLNEFSLTARSLRVSWSGGVGSCHFLRSGELRVQISASSCPYIGQSVNGYSYALCISL